LGLLFKLTHCPTNPLWIVAINVLDLFLWRAMFSP
jgi:hypothetical protein